MMLSNHFSEQIVTTNPKSSAMFSSRHCHGSLSSGSKILQGWASVCHLEKWLLKFTYNPWSYIWLLCAALRKFKFSWLETAGWLGMATTEMLTWGSFFPQTPPNLGGHLWVFVAFHFFWCISFRGLGGWTIHCWENSCLSWPLQVFQHCQHWDSIISWLKGMGQNVDVPKWLWKLRGHPFVHWLVICVPYHRCHFAAHNSFSVIPKFGIKLSSQKNLQTLRASFGL